MRINTQYILITDIGSTTTKAVLLDNSEPTPRLLGVSHSPTTVEAPFNDVSYGIRAAVVLLEKQCSVQLLVSGTKDGTLTFNANTSYFSTSSAGGGLQILVIGLTMFDSASSGKRSAYGAGGVILDTFAIDDKRQAMEQMLAMRNLHPDMILLCGGTDGGAISGVLRMAEIVRIANPAPKFDTSAKIPALYAGNKDAAPIIKKLISEAFDLYIQPNLRPTLETENLQPTQDKIQQLFMENVMEQAPGYTLVKPVVTAEILPTPVGVQKALSLIANNEKHNIFAFDIGGATTDVFSYINGHFQRTVSANLGMSYSAWNVLRESGLPNIMRWLPVNTDVSTVRDYIANKCLRPTDNPETTIGYRIEHALAREALNMALEQHRLMHYNESKIGYLDKLKNNEIEKFELQFEYQREDKKHRFQESDIGILIGAGGIFAHAQNPSQCVMMLVDSYRPKGITEIWIDRQFISPHLGVLSQSAAATATHLMNSDCLEKLALHIAPAFSARTKKALLSVEVSDKAGKRTLEILPNAFYYLPQGEKTLSIITLNKSNINTLLDLQNLITSLPVIIDTRLEPSQFCSEVEKTLRLYPDDALETVISAPAIQTAETASGTWLKSVELPYSGDVLFKAGDKVEPDAVVAVNMYNPPRLYIVNGFSGFPDITPQQIAESLNVKAGDKIEFDQNYANLPLSVEIARHNSYARRLLSPIRGKIDYIDEFTGIMVVSEIQDYSSKPVKVNYADLLMLKPKLAKRYLMRQQGDFVYQGEVLAKRIERNSEGAPPVFVKTPSTGTITEIDLEQGVITIVYQHKPLEFQAHVSGKVQDVTLSQGLRISYEGMRVEGKIAFGRECHGALHLLKEPADKDSLNMSGSIVALAFVPDLQYMKDLASLGIRGLVCHTLEAVDLVTWLGFEPGVINTGNESLPFSILILGGFGKQPLPSNLLNVMLNKTKCYLNPHTRIRAGVVRPFICF